MKRLLSSVFALLCVVSSVSCSTPTGTQSKLENNLGSPFSAKMTVNLDKLSAEGTIYRKGDRCWEAEFDSPNTLSGVKLSFEEKVHEIYGFRHILNAVYLGRKLTVPTRFLRNVKLYVATI